MAKSKRGELIRAMHEKGFTYEEIGNLLGVSKQCAWEAATKSKNGFHESVIRKVKYEGLRNWLLDNRVNLSELERRCGGCKLRCVLYSGHDPSKKNIDAILRVTGLTYEECFKEVEE